MTSRRWFVLIFVSLMVMVGAVSFGTPRGAGPDEAAHLIRAAGLVRGDVLGAATDGQDAIRTFDVPGWVGQPNPGCYAFQPDIPASCAAAIPSDGRIASTAGSYQVWAHVLPGVGTLFPGQTRTVWVSRLLGALVPVALISASLTNLLGRRRRVEAVAVLLALTPTAVSSIAVVNPSGLAIGGAVALWVAGLSLERDDRPTAMLLASGWAALILSRGDGLVWCALIAVLVLSVRRRRVRDVVADLPAAANGLVIGSTALALGWSLFVRPALIEAPESATGRALFTKIVGETGMHLREAIGVVGWLDTSIPESMIYVWLVVLGVLVGIAVLNGTRREVQVLAAGLASLVVLPWGVELVQASSAGLFWQGRYGLPLLVGLVILTGTMAGRGPSIAHMHRVELVVGWGAFLVWNVGFLQSVRRWSVGANGSFAPWNWSVGIGVPATVMILVVHMVASAALVFVASSVPLRPSVLSSTR